MIVLGFNYGLQRMQTGGITTCSYAMFAKLILK